MRKSLLLFFLLLVAILFWKISETPEQSQWDDTTVEELVSDSEDNQIAKN